MTASVPHLVLDKVVDVSRRDGHTVGQRRNIQATASERLDEGGDWGQDLGTQATRLERGERAEKKEREDQV